MTAKLNTLMAAPKISLLYDDDGAVYVQRIKVEGKYFSFNEKGQMQDGLQYCKADGGFYYFDDNGYQKTGRVTSVENDDDDYILLQHQEW